MEKQRCYSVQDDDDDDGDGGGGGALGGGYVDPASNITFTPQPGVIQHDINHCLAWRRFAK